MNAYNIIKYVRDSIIVQRDLLTDIEDDISEESLKLVLQVITKLSYCSQLLNKADKL